MDDEMYLLIKVSVSLIGCSYAEENHPTTLTIFHYWYQWWVTSIIILCRKKLTQNSNVSHSIGDRTNQQTKSAILKIVHKRSKWVGSFL
jgi:hypothetical protein